MEIDDPHLHEGSLWVNGVDVVPFVEAELNRRFPGRELRAATTPSGLRAPASYAEVLAVRSEHQAIVREYLATVTEEELVRTGPHPWAPEHRVQVLHCLHVILNEEWEHQRYAVRDLRKAIGAHQVAADGALCARHPDATRP
jgi:hypothetical protein